MTYNLKVLQQGLEQEEAAHKATKARLADKSKITESIEGAKSEAMKGKAPSFIHSFSFHHMRMVDRIRFETECPLLPCHTSNLPHNPRCHARPSLVPLFWSFSGPLSLSLSLSLRPCPVPLFLPSPVSSSLQRWSRSWWRRGLLRCGWRTACWSWRSTAACWTVTTSSPCRSWTSSAGTRTG